MEWTDRNKQTPHTSPTTSIPTSTTENLYKLKSLEYLNVALNNLTKIENVESLESLRKLDLTVNFVDITALEESVSALKYCFELKELYLTGNPCSSWEHFRSYVIANLPTLEKLDGVDITRTERIQAKQKEQDLNRLLAEAVTARLAEKKRKAESGEEEDEDYEYTPELRSKMYDDFNENKEEEERKKVAEEAAKKFAPAVDPLKEAQKKMSAKVEAPEDGSIPRQRNTGKLDFEFREDTSGNIVVEVEVPRYLDTSQMDVDIHPMWFQVIVKKNNLLLHTGHEVDPDRARVQRLGPTGNLLLTMPRTSFNLREHLTDKGTDGTEKYYEVKPVDNVIRAPTNKKSGGRGGAGEGETAGEKSSTTYRNIVAKQDDGEGDENDFLFEEVGKEKEKTKTEEDKADALAKVLAQIDFDESEVPPLE